MNNPLFTPDCHTYTILHKHNSTNVHIIKWQGQEHCYLCNNNVSKQVHLGNNLVLNQCCPSNNIASATILSSNNAEKILQCQNVPQKGIKTLWQHNRIDSGHQQECLKSNIKWRISQKWCYWNGYKNKEYKQLIQSEQRYQRKTMNLVKNIPDMNWH